MHRKVSDLFILVLLLIGPRGQKLAISGPGPTGATSGALANTPRNTKLTILASGLAGATSGALANKPP